LQNLLAPAVIAGAQGFLLSPRRAGPLHCAAENGTGHS
jgi:hypothetical protein